MMQRSDDIKELAAALAKAQGAMDNASKDKTNPHFKSKYATLSSVWDAIREPLSTNGLSIVQLPSLDEQGRIWLDTMLLHSSGQWLSASYSLPATKNDAQGFGSALTYMRRYALTGVGVAPDDDDDGNTASKPEPVTPYSAAPTRQNGNGNTGNVDPRMAAEKWQKEALAAIKSMPDSKSLAAWEDKNTLASIKLRGIDEALHRTLTDALADAYERLNPLAAQ